MIVARHEEAGYIAMYNRIRRGCILTTFTYSHVHPRVVPHQHQIIYQGLPCGAGATEAPPPPPPPPPPHLAFNCSTHAFFREKHDDHCIVVETTYCVRMHNEN